MSIIDQTKIGLGQGFEAGMMSMFRENVPVGQKIVIGITHDPFASYHGQAGEASVERGQMILVSEGRNLKRVRRDFQKLDRQLTNLMGRIGNIPVEKAEDWNVNAKASYFYVYAWFQ